MKKKNSLTDAIMKKLGLSKEGKGVSEENKGAEISIDQDNPIQNVPAGSSSLQDSNIFFAKDGQYINTETRKDNQDVNASIHQDDKDIDQGLYQIDDEEPLPKLKDIVNTSIHKDGKDVNAKNVPPKSGKKTEDWSMRSWRYPPELLEKLERVSFWSRKSKQEIVHEALEEYFGKCKANWLRSLPKRDNE